MAQTPKTPINDEVLKNYLNAMGKVPLLSHEEEIHCGKAIEAGGSDGVAAKNRLVRANLRLVVLLARKCLASGMTLADKIQEGNIGLIRAAEKYDYRKGFRFATYATWWIKQAIIRGGELTNRTIRMPSHRVTLLSRIHNAQRYLFNKLGSEPDLTTVAEFVELPREQVEMLVQIGQDVLSLDEPITEDNASSLMDLVEDPNSVSILDVLQYMASVEELDDLLARLTPREEKVIRLRYGLREHRPLSLDEIGARVGLTRERIRQIEMKAMGILRKRWKLASH